MIKFTCPNCGLTIPMDDNDWPLLCVCGLLINNPNDTGPTFLHRLGNFVKAGVKFARSGFATRTEKEIDYILETFCKTCNYYNGKICTHKNCGCRIAKDGFRNKLLWASESCPINKWGKKIDRVDPMWITNKQRIIDTQKLITILPSDIYAVAGVPRSGMVSAGIIAEILHLPLFTIHPETGLQELPHGWRLKDVIKSGKILVVDDTVCSGKSMRALSKVLNFDHYKAVVYCNPEHSSLVDFYAVSLFPPHYLEWNFFNSINSNNLAVDFDGVLCEDDSGLPKFLPRKSVLKLICTGRMERHRDVTERWLKQHDVKYEKLLMWQGGDKERWQDHGVAKFKAKSFIESGADIFVESCPIQSQVIAEVSQKTVICPTSAQVYRVDNITKTNRVTQNHREKLEVVSCFFNPCRYNNILENYHKFRQNMVECGITPKVIELAFDNDEFQLTDATMYVRGTREKNLLWQKERLLNSLIETLDIDTTVICWIDTDVIFEDKNWTNKCIDELFRYKVLQLFDTCIYLDKDSSIMKKLRSTGWYYQNNRDQHGDFTVSHPGFAWAGRADWIRKYGLYNFMITGGGDAAMLPGFTDYHNYHVERINVEWSPNLNEWTRNVYSNVKGHFGYINGKVNHLYHGTIGNRKYVDRWDYLKDGSYNPNTDIKIDNNGLLTWTDFALTEKKDMVEKVKRYFEERREDE